MASKTYYKWMHMLNRIEMHRHRKQTCGYQRGEGGGVNQLYFREKKEGVKRKVIGSCRTLLALVWTLGIGAWEPFEVFEQRSSKILLGINRIIGCYVVKRQNSSKRLNRNGLSFEFVSLFTVRHICDAGSILSYFTKYLFFM